MSNLIKEGILTKAPRLFLKKFGTMSSTSKPKLTMADKGNMKAL